jgi:murein DD-endopeptidase MepM/ murein hydrolase activator NlpD
VTASGTRSRWRLAAATLLASSFALLTLLGLGATPAPSPQLYLEVAGRVPAGLPFDVFVSSSTPATITLRYADDAIEVIEQEVRVSFLAAPGRTSLVVDAVDGAGRGTTMRSEVVGLITPQPVLDAPERAVPGDPLTLRFDWAPLLLPEGAAAAMVADAWVELDGRILDALVFDGGLLALAAIPVQEAPGPRRLRAVVVDEFGLQHSGAATLSVDPNPNPVQEIAVSPSVLAVSTPEGRELEARTLAEAFALVPREPRWAEPFMLPLEGRGTSAFGLPRRFGPGGNVSYHLGTDIAAPTGTPIVATNDGVVLVAGQYPIKGGLVILDHGFGVTSLYFHQSQITVSVGDVVARGERIGYVGSTGLSTGPHLHWEMRVDGVPSNPLAWVGRHHPVPLGTR